MTTSSLSLEGMTKIMLSWTLSKWSVLILTRSRIAWRPWATSHRKWAIVSEPQSTMPGRCRCLMCAGAILGPQMETQIRIPWSSVGDMMACLINGWRPSRKWNLGTFTNDIKTEGEGVETSPNFADELLLIGCLKSWNADKDGVVKICQNFVDRISPYNLRAVQHQK